MEYLPNAGHETGVVFRILYAQPLDCVLVDAGRSFDQTVIYDVLLVDRQLRFG